MSKAEAEDGKKLRMGSGVGGQGGHSNLVGFWSLFSEDGGLTRKIILVKKPNT